MWAGSVKACFYLSRLSNILFAWLRFSGSISREYLLQCWPMGKRLHQLMVGVRSTHLALGPADEFMSKTDQIFNLFEWIERELVTIVDRYSHSVCFVVATSNLFKGNAVVLFVNSPNIVRLVGRALLAVVWLRGLSICHSFICRRPQGPKFSPRISEP